MNILILVINIIFPGAGFILKKKYRLAAIQGGTALIVTLVFWEVAGWIHLPQADIIFVIADLVFITVFAVLLYKGEAPKQSLRRFFAVAAYAAVLAFFFFAAVPFFFRTYMISSASMEPSLYIGEKVFTDNLYYKVHDIEREDIVVLKLDIFLRRPQNMYRIYRVLGLPGETIEIIDHEVYINGEYYPEDYIKVYETNLPEQYQPVFDKYTLSSDEYFVLGDNRPNSSDSRYMGPIKREQIIAKYIYTYKKTSR